MTLGFNILEGLGTDSSMDLPALSPAPVPAAPKLQTPDTLRTFGDIPATRKAIYDNVYKTAASLPPVSNKTHTLRLRDVQWADPENYTKADRKKAILTGTTLGRRLRGTWELLENSTGNVLDSKQATVFKVPHLTEGGTFVHRGNEYALKNQQRLRSGIFVREKENGELEAHANILENGPAHRYFLDPDKGVFYIRLGQSQVPMLPLLKAMGATDNEIRNVWGSDIFATNYQKADASVIGKLQEKILKDRVDPSQPVEPQLRAAFESMTLDPEVTKRTLGKPFARMDKDTMLATTAKLLAVQRKEADVDDRDHLAYQTFLGPEDLFTERLAKDRAGIQRQLLFKMAGRGNLKSLPAGALQGQLESALLESGLGQCFDADTYVLLKRGWTKWPDVQDDDEFACRVNDTIFYAKANKIFRYQYSGELLGCKTRGFSYLVTPNHRLWCKAKPTSDYREERAEQAFGLGRYFQTTIPALSNANDADFVLSAVVFERHGHSSGTLTISGDLWAEFLGWYMAEGWISDEQPTEISGIKSRRQRVCISQDPVVNPDKHAAIVKLLSQLPFKWNFNYSNKTFCINSKQLAAELRQYGLGSGQKRLPRYCFNWTERRLRILVEAYMAGDGNTYNGYQKAETTSQGLAYDLVEAFGRLGGTGRISVRRLSKKNAKWADSYVVSFGCNSQTYVPSDTDNSRRGKSSAYYRQNYTGAVYCAAVPGERIYVMRDGKPHWSLNSLEEINPIEILDKITQISRMGEGGIPSYDAIPDEARAVQPSHMGFVDPLRTPECYDEATEVLTRNGWRFWNNVTKDDEFACLIDGKLEWHKPSKMHRYAFDGELLGARTSTVEYLVTSEHRMWVRPGDAGSEYRISSAAETHGRNRYLQTGHDGYISRNPQKTFTLPKIERTSNGMTIIVEPICMEDWCEFLGWYLSEGHYTYVEDPGDVKRRGGDYRVGISQSRTANPDKCKKIEALLSRLPFRWSYNRHMRCYIIGFKQLAAYMRQFGDCYQKFIPTYVFDAAQPAREKFLNAMLLGDGRKSKKGKLTQLCTCSLRLAEDFQRLAFTLGIPSTIALEHDKRFPHYRGTYVVQLHERKERELVRRNYFKQRYTGYVYCASVPGGLLYVRRGSTSGHWSGNSFKAGVDVFMAGNARKGPDGTLYARFKDPKTGKDIWKSPQEVADTAVTFPSALNRPGKRVPAMKNGKLTWVPKNQIGLVMPPFENAFSPIGNMVPLKSMVKGQRVAMASRMLTQALPLKDPQAPAVQSAMPDTGGQRSFEDEYGKQVGAVHAEQDGKVVAVEGDRVTVRYDDGRTDHIELHNNTPYNRKTFVHQTPVVRPGQRFSAGSLLAKSNFTDHTGATALGLNARVAYMPWGGLNFEDATVISESMAKRLTSEHMYQHQLEKSERTKYGKNPYISLFPAKFDKKTLENLGDDGVIKPGTKVNFGDPLILGIEERDKALNKLHKKGQAGFQDVSVTWEHHDPGVVTDVVQGKDGPVVVVKSMHPMQVGDKMSGRYGDKGVVSAIVPDSQMPHDSQGNPFEVLLSPLGVISRTNPAQLVEGALGKIAAKTGRPYKVEDFRDDIPDRVEWALQELARHGLSDTEDLTDPVTGNKIPAVNTGVRFFMKLHHTAESKGQGRAGGGYTAEETPAKGGATGSKRISLLDVNALISHGATEVLRDAGAIRGQKNEDYWLQFMQGHTPRQPRVPMVYNKFLNELQAAGINVLRQGSQLHIMAMTDKDVDQLAGDRELEHGDTVEFDKDLKPIKGGLFDEALTGGHHGNRWAAIRLHEAMPNPVMEEPIRRVLGLTQQKFEDVLGGKEKINGKTGPSAIGDALAAIDLPKALLITRAQAKNGSQAARDAAVRRLGYLKSAERLGIHPKDWMLSRVPVLPPQFRPVSVMGNKKVPLVADPNYLYKELLEANNNLASMHKNVGGDAVGEERLAVYNAFKAVTGLGDPITQQSQEKQVRGILKSIFGSSPKFGTVQRKLISSTVDNVGRAVVSPNPDLDMDTVGLPEDRAFDVYQRFVVRKLKRSGMGLMDAVRHVRDKTPLARKTLLEEMQQRPVIINRAPVLHRFGIMAFKPTLVKGSTLQVPPLVVKGFNMDFDGDAVQYHVPTDEEARKEALDKMLPSRQLLSPADFKTPVHVPGTEYVSGLYHASTHKGSRKHTFRNKDDVRKAWLAGEIDVGDVVRVLEHK